MILQDVPIMHSHPWQSPCMQVLAHLDDGLNGQIYIVGVDQADCKAGEARKCAMYRTLTQDFAVHSVGRVGGDGSDHVCGICTSMQHGQVY